MLPVGWLVAAVLVAILLTMWFTFTLTRLDRLHARVDAAQAALDAQLVRRAAALQHVVESPETALPVVDHARFEAVARAALDAGLAPGAAREQVENAVGRAVAELVDRADAADPVHVSAGPGTTAAPLHPAAVAEVREAAARVLISRRFYNDAVRDTRALRARRMPRLLRMAGRREMPQFFDIDDTLPAAEKAARPDPTEQDPR